MPMLLRISHCSFQVQSAAMLKTPSDSRLYCRCTEQDYNTFDLCNKLPQTLQFKTTQIKFLTVLGVRVQKQVSLVSRGQQGQFFLKFQGQPSILWSLAPSPFLPSQQVRIFASLLFLFQSHIAYFKILTFCFLF